MACACSKPCLRDPNPPCVAARSIDLITGKSRADFNVTIALCKALSYRKFRHSSRCRVASSCPRGTFGAGCALPAAANRILEGRISHAFLVHGRRIPCFQTCPPSFERLNAFSAANFHPQSSLFTDWPLREPVSRGLCTCSCPRLIDSVARSTLQESLCILAAGQGHGLSVSCNAGHLL